MTNYYYKKSTKGTSSSSVDELLPICGCIVVVTVGVIGLNVMLLNADVECSVTLWAVDADDVKIVVSDDKTEDEPVVVAVVVDVCVVVAFVVVVVVDGVVIVVDFGVGVVVVVVVFVVLVVVASVAVDDGAMVVCSVEGGVDVSVDVLSDVCVVLGVLDTFGTDAVVILELSELDIWYYQNSFWKAVLKKDWQHLD